METRVSSLFGIKYPLIQAGMVWCSGWELASAVSNAGGLGIIGSGSMYPEVLVEHVIKCIQSTNKPFAVNVPLLYPNIEEHIETIIKYKVPVVFSSAGNPKTYTERLKAESIKVVHVVSSAKFAMKAEAAGVDAVVAEGFEAGGHNGQEETTTMVLVPLVKKAVSIPVIAAGGIGTGRGMLAALALGADAVQIGSRFVCSQESSAHLDFKKSVVKAKEGDTKLSMKKLVAVRLLNNDFYNLVRSAEERGASKEELVKLLGKGRAKKGMFQGDLSNGELEIGQISAGIDKILPAAEIVAEIITEFEMARKELHTTFS